MMLGAALCLPFLLSQHFANNAALDFGISNPSTGASFSKMQKQQQQQLADTPRETIPLIPLQHCVKYTKQPTEQYKLDEHIISMPGIGPSASALARVNMGDTPETFTFLDIEPSIINPLLAFKEYQTSDLGAVTHLWISILQTITHDKIKTDEVTYDTIVIDGAMQTGFYTSLAASFYFPVHAFEMRRECMDLAQLNLLGGQRAVPKLSHIYNMGLWNHTTIWKKPEACHQRRGLRERKTAMHLTPMLTLDLFLDELETSLSHLETEGGVNVTAAAEADDADDPWTKEIAVIKLGPTPEALQGLQRHLFKCYNIIIEHAADRSDFALRQYELLQQDGFQAYLLYTAAMAGHTNAPEGLEDPKKHPLLESPLTDDFRMIWKVVDWKALLGGQICAESKDHVCTFWFNRVAVSPKMR